MDISFYGANCFKLSTKSTSVVVDDNLETLGAVSILTDSDVAVYTQQRLMNDKSSKARILLDSPGEYELDDMTVVGIQTKAYTDGESDKTATIYKFVANDFQVVVLGHVVAKLSEKVLEAIGVVDVLIVPVGGNGFTLDAEDTANVIKLIAPRVTVPSNFADPGLKFEVPANEVGDFFAKLAIHEPEPLRSLKLKGELEEGVVLLERL